MDAELVQRLATGEGARLLAALPAYDPEEVLPLQRRLRDAGFDPELVSAALTQSRLRARGQAKFGRFAAGMLFTADGLEQATRLEVAARHAQRYRRAGVRVVHDLGCGIGADAMALAALDVGVSAVEGDPLTAAVAAVNLRHWGHAEVRAGRVEDAEVTAGRGTTGVWLDPSRRDGQRRDRYGRARRIVAPEAMSPPWSHVLHRAGEVPATGAKVGPSFPRAALPLGTEAQWTSWEGELLECAIWWGPLVTSPGRTAAVCRAAQPAHVVTEAETAGGTPRVSSPAQLGPVLYDPDRAVRIAGLTGALTAAVDGQELETGLGLVCSQRDVALPWARRWHVREVFRYREQSLRQWARAERIGPLVVKTRGVSADPVQVRRQARPRGDNPATLLVTRIAGDPWALVLEERAPE